MILAKQLAVVAAVALLAGCAGASGLLASGIAASGSVSGSFASQAAAGAVQIPFRLLKPERDGPFPAIVMVHDCSGLGHRSSGAPLRWARKLLAQGYVVIIPDSFSPRGLPDGVCANDRAQAANADVRAGDARAALAYLRSLPDIDPVHIALMGGSTTLATMADPRADFAAAIALYPGCGASYGQWRASRSMGPDGPLLSFSGAYKPAAPLLILIGEKDDWTPAPYCRKLAEAAQQAGYPVSLKIYPGALHSFDSNFPVRYSPDRNNPNKANGRGATTGGDPAAWADAERQVTAFFGKYLKGAD